MLPWYGGDSVKAGLPDHLDIKISHTILARVLIDFEIVLVAHARSSIAHTCTDHIHYYCMKPYNIKGTACALYPVYVEHA